MPQLTFTYSPMNAGKSTAALQYQHSYATSGRHGLLLTRLDRGGPGLVTSRVGLSASAIELEPGSRVHHIVQQAQRPVDHLIVDEAQFITVEQVDELADIVDHHGMDVFAFGLLADFRGELFPASARLLSLADISQQLQTHPLCWCGSPARMNARVTAGVMVTSGSQVEVGDTATQGVSHYVVLCRKHHREQRWRPAATAQQVLASQA